MVIVGNDDSPWMLFFFSRKMISVTSSPSQKQMIASNRTCAKVYAIRSRPLLRFSSLMVARSLQMDWMELKMPIQMQAQTKAKAPFLVAEYCANISDPVTMPISNVINTVDRIILMYFFSLKKIRPFLPKYILICSPIDAFMR